MTPAIAAGLLVGVVGLATAVLAAVAISWRFARSYMVQSWMAASGSWVSDQACSISAMASLIRKRSSCQRRVPSFARALAK